MTRSTGLVPMPRLSLRSPGTRHPAAASIPEDDTHLDAGIPDPSDVPAAFPEVPDVANAPDYQDTSDVASAPVIQERSFSSQVADLTNQELLLAAKAAPAGEQWPPSSSSTDVPLWYV